MRKALFPLLLALLGGCSVGPDYAGPPPTTPGQQFHRADPGMAGEPRLAVWWTALGDAGLDAAVGRALEGNFGIAAARARLEQARALLRERRAGQRPSGQVGAGYARKRPSFADFGQSLPGIEPVDIDLYEVGYDASWELDLFGRRRRATEAAVRDYEARTADLDAVRLSIAAETAQAYVALRHAQARLALARDAERIQSRQFDLIRDRERVGTASDLDVQRLSAQLDATRAEIPGIEAAIAVELDRLAVLGGGLPGTLDGALAQAVSVPHPPETIAIGDPGAVIRRRPDVRAAERRLAAATARIGVNKADFFPTVSLRGVAGLRANGVGSLGEGFTFGVGPSMSWLFPDFGAIRARVGIATAQRDEALALYRESVVEALRDAEAATMRYARLGEEQALRLRVDAAATRAATLAEARYRAGAGSLIDMLDAERERVRTAMALADVEAARTAAFILLHKSLGLGWQDSKGDPEK